MAKLPTASGGNPTAGPGANRYRVRLHTTGDWWNVIVLIGLMSATVIVSLFVALVVREAVVSGVIKVPAIFRQDQYASQAIPGPTPNPALAAPTLALPEAGAGEESQRVTVLVLGIDRRPGEYGRTRTDTIILMTVDPEGKGAGMLSLPRDLYVELPGRGLDRINTAYPYGGGDLAIETVKYNLGVPVDHYIVIDFQAFVTLVDEIGGIDLEVPYNIDDPTYPDHEYGFDPFYIDAGMHHMDGELALKYARTRHADNDFYRARRQQQVIFAIREKIMRLDMLPQLVTKAPRLYTTLTDSIDTDMTLDEMIALAVLVQEIDEENISNAVIDDQYVTNYRTPQGSSVLVPDHDKIRPVLEEIFHLGEEAGG
jgi:LCP family protein required for cell wall assembly